MRLRGIRGATTTGQNKAEDILQETARLMEALIEQNKLTEEQVVSVIFTATPDLTAEFPAKACRMLGWTQTALLGAVEADVPHGPARCIRILIHAYLACDAEPSHIYFNDAVRLRPDRTGQR